MVNIQGHDRVLWDTIEAYPACPPSNPATRSRPRADRRASPLEDNLPSHAGLDSSAVLGGNPLC